MIKKHVTCYMFNNFSVRYEILVAHARLYSLEYTRLMGRKFDDTGLIVIRKKKKSNILFHLKHSTKTDTKICVRNYDRSSNNTIKVDFLVIGGM